MIGLQALILLTALHAGGQTDAIVARLNHYRKAAGLEPVHLDPKLSKGCQAHADYVARNLGDGPITIAVHKEESGKPGYTKEGDEAGRRSVIKFAPVKNPGGGAGVMDTFIHSLYHRKDPLHPDLMGIGVGVAKSDRFMIYVVGCPAGYKASREVVYPADGQKAIPLTLAKGEVPNPVPPEGRKRKVGYPITAAFAYAAKIKGAKVVLTDAAGKEVKGWVSSPEVPANKEWPTNSATICIIPKQPLEPDTVYKVRMSATVNGKKWEKSWRFTTVKK